MAQLDAKSPHSKIMTPLQNLMFGVAPYDQVAFTNLYKEMVAHAMNIAFQVRSDRCLKRITEEDLAFLGDMTGVFMHLKTQASHETHTPPVFEDVEETEGSGPPPVNPPQHTDSEVQDELAQVRTLLATLLGSKEGPTCILSSVKSRLSKLNTADAKAVSLGGELATMREEQQAAKMREEAAKKALLDEIDTLKRERDTFATELNAATQREHTRQREISSLQQNLQASKDREATGRTKLEAAIKREQGLRVEVREVNGKLRASEVELAQARAKIGRLMQQGVGVGAGGEGAAGIANSNSAGSDSPAVNGGGRRARRRRGGARAAGGAGGDGGFTSTCSARVVKTYLCMRRAVVGAYTCGLVRPWSYVWGRLCRSNGGGGGEASGGGDKRVDESMQARSSNGNGDGVRAA